MVLLFPITLDTAGAKSNNVIKLTIMWSGFILCENMNVNIRYSSNFSVNAISTILMLLIAADTLYIP